MPFFLDDGTEVNPEDLTIPDKCLKCRQYTARNLAVIEPEKLSSEWEANVMCILTRIDQMEEIEFYCRDYKYNLEWKTKIS